MPDTSHDRLSITRRAFLSPAATAGAGVALLAKCAAAAPATEG